MPPGCKPQRAGPNVSDNLRYAYDEAVRFQHDVSPICGGWLTVSAVPQLSLAGIPGFLQPTNTGGAASWEATYPLAFARENLTDAPGVIWTLRNISVRYNRAVVGATIALTLYSMLKDGSAAPVVERQWTEAAEFTTVGAWTTYVIPADITETLDVETRIYLLHFHMFQPADNQVDISTMTLDIEKTAVE